MKLDHLPIALCLVLCGAIAGFRYALPPIPESAAALPAFADAFAAFARRERVLLFPLGVATSISALLLLLRHGALTSWRGLLLAAASSLMFTSGLLTTFMGEPGVKNILRLSRSGQVADLQHIPPLYQQWASGHWLQLGFQAAVLVCLLLAARQPDRGTHEVTSPGALTPQHRTLLFLLGTATLFQGYDNFIVSMALPYIGRDLAASERALGFALSAIRIGSLLSVVFGRVADRRGRRGLLLVTIVAYTVATAATGFSRGLFDFVVCQLVAEIFLVTELSIAQVVIAEEFPTSFRSRGQGFLGAFGALGAGLAAVLFPAFQETALGWRGLYFVGIVPLLLIAYLRRSLPETARWHAARQRGETARARSTTLVASGARRTFLVLVALGFAMGVCGSPAFGFASYRATNAFGWTPSEVSAMVLLGGGVGMGGWFVFGILAEKLGRRVVGVSCYVGLAAAAWLYYASPWLWPAFTALVFLDAGCAVALNALGTELFPTELRGTAKSWITNATVVGAVTGMAAVGGFADLAGGADRVICLLSLLPLVASGTLTLLPETRGLELEEIVASAGHAGAIASFGSDPAPPASFN